MAADSIRLEAWQQGPSGSGQGGLTAHRLETLVGRPLTVALRRPIPLERDLGVVAVGDAWHLVDPASPDEPVMIATAWTPDVPDPEPVSIAEAEAARGRFPFLIDHPLDECFSCGLTVHSMLVHPGRMPDGRWATDWRPPPWAVGDDGTVDPGSLWAGIDCTQGFYVGDHPRRDALTVQLAVEVIEPLRPDERYALVGWNGDYSVEWDGRKRGACGAAFDMAGRCVARSRSFWVALQ